MWFISYIILGIPVMLDPSPEPSPYPVIYRDEDRKIAAKHILKMSDDQLSFETLLQFTDKQVDRILRRLDSDLWIVSEQ